MPIGVEKEFLLLFYSLFVRREHLHTSGITTILLYKNLQTSAFRKIHL